MTDTSNARQVPTGRVGRGAIGVLVRNDRMLIVRRALGLAMEGRWCFPGGHVEAHETSRVAVKRELAEELGINVEPIERLGAVRVTEPRYILAVWTVRFVSGDLKLNEAEVSEIRWVTGSELREIAPAVDSNPDVLALLGM